MSQGREEKTLKVPYCIISDVIIFPPFKSILITTYFLGKSLYEKGSFISTFVFSYVENIKYNFY